MEIGRHATCQLIIALAGRSSNILLRAGRFDSIEESVDIEQSLEFHRALSRPLAYLGIPLRGQLATFGRRTT
jgi:hypothetical protein